MTQGDKVVVDCDPTSRPGHPEDGNGKLVDPCDGRIKKVEGSAIREVKAQRNERTATEQSV